MLELPVEITSNAIVARRGPRNAVDPNRPYAYLVEPECNAHGNIVDVATIFLTNRECPFRCLMCDLWKNTLTQSVEPGQIPTQIQWALAQLPPAQAVKLYNSGNFFDPQAIPTSDHETIAELVRGFETVIVENHPRLCGDDCLRFRDLIAPAKLEIALGLETCHPEVLAALNKNFTLDLFAAAVQRLHAAGIATRVFLLHGAPLLSADEATPWTLRSIEYALDRGVGCVSVIATRSGNGIMDDMQAAGLHTPPSGESLEQVQTLGLQRRDGRGRVLVDLWEVDAFFACPHCRGERIERMRQMNLRQTVSPEINCPHDGRANG